MTRRLLLLGAILLSPSLALADLVPLPLDGNPGPGRVVGDRGSTCGEQRLNSDGTYESGLAFRHGGLWPRPEGAFAECYHGPVEVCSLTYDLTTGYSYYPTDLTFDAFVWADDQGAPGAVLREIVGIAPLPLPIWPEVGRVVVPLAEPLCVEGGYWVGSWSNWPDQPTPAYWYMTLDTDGPGGCAFVNLGDDYPLPGWQNVNVVFEDPDYVHASGIGCEVRDCFATSALPTTWGRVKSLYAQ